MFENTTWIPYVQTIGGAQHTVVGDLRVLRMLYSPQLNNARDIYVWLPPEYEAAENSARRYPVLYMHDGLNLFDAHVAHSGEWRVDEALTALYAESGGALAAIVVGLPNNKSARASEYSPYPNPTGPILVTEPRGDLYLSYLVETVKPLIDSTFRTLPGPASTAIAGSSMGGLISLYAFLRHPEVFGACGSFSPAYGIGDRGLLHTIEEALSTRPAPRTTRVIYLDVGGREGVVVGALEPGWETRYPNADAAYAGGVRELRDALLARGYQAGPDGNLMYVEVPEHEHNEAAWAQRLPAALRFLIGHMHHGL